MRPQLFRPFGDLSQIHHKPKERGRNCGERFHLLDLALLKVISQIDIR